MFPLGDRRSASGLAQVVCWLLTVPLAVLQSKLAAYDPGRRGPPRWFAKLPRRQGGKAGAASTPDKQMEEAALALLGELKGLLEVRLAAGAGAPWLTEPGALPTGAMAVREALQGAAWPWDAGRRRWDARRAVRPSWSGEGEGRPLRVRRPRPPRRAGQEGVGDPGARVVGGALQLGGGRQRRLAGGRGATRWRRRCSGHRRRSRRSWGWVREAVHLVGPVESPEVHRALEESVRGPVSRAEVVLAQVRDEAGTVRAAEAHARAPAGVPLWVVYGKGKGSPFGEGPVRTVLRARGLMDTKVAAVSETLSAGTTARALTPSGPVPAVARRHAVAEACDARSGAATFGTRRTPGALVSAPR